MDGRALTDFTFLALFVAARGDGRLHEDEVHQVFRSVQTTGERGGVAPRTIHRASRRGTRGFHRSRARLAAKVVRRADRLAARVPRELALLYDELVRIAGADGAQCSGEDTVLDVVRERWRLTSSG